MIAGLLAVAWGITCPPVTCASLGSGVCASRAVNALELNSNGCPPDSECQASLLFQWWFTVLGNQNYQCQSVTGSSIDTGDGSPITCRTKQTKKNFKSLNSVVDCVQDQDCVMEDGTYSDSSCLCTLRTTGKGLCQPDSSNDVFSGYWNACGSDNQITDMNEYRYWAYYMTNWVYLQTDVTCSSFMGEIATMQALQTAYNSGVWLGLLAVSLMSVV